MNVFHEIKVLNFRTESFKRECLLATVPWELVRKGRVVSKYRICGSEKACQRVLDWETTQGLF